MSPADCAMEMAQVRDDIRSQLFEVAAYLEIAAVGGNDDDSVLKPTIEQWRLDLKESTVVLESQHMAGGFKFDSYFNLEAIKKMMFQRIWSEGFQVDDEGVKATTTRYFAGERIRLKARFIEGVISRVKSNGTFDIKFDDHTFQRSVKESQIEKSQTTKETTGLTKDSTSLTKCCYENSALEFFLALNNPVLKVATIIEKISKKSLSEATAMSIESLIKSSSERAEDFHLNACSSDGREDEVRLMLVLLRPTNMGPRFIPSKSFVGLKNGYVWMDGHEHPAGIAAIEYQNKCLEDLKRRKKERRKDRKEQRNAAPAPQTVMLDPIADEHKERAPRGSIDGVSDLDIEKASLQQKVLDRYMSFVSSNVATVPESISGYWRVDPIMLEEYSTSSSTSSTTPPWYSITGMTGANDKYAVVDWSYINDAALVPKRTPRWRCVNSNGVGLRNSKQVDDRCNPELVVKKNQIVDGELEDGGWIRWVDTMNPARHGKYMPFLHPNGSKEELFTPLSSNSPSLRSTLEFAKHGLLQKMLPGDRLDLHVYVGQEDQRVSIESPLDSMHALNAFSLAMKEELFTDKGPINLKTDYWRQSSIGTKPSDITFNRTKRNIAIWNLKVTLDSLPSEKIEMNPLDHANSFNQEQLDRLREGAISSASKYMRVPESWAEMMLETYDFEPQTLLELWETGEQGERKVCTETGIPYRKLAQARALMGEESEESEESEEREESDEMTKNTSEDDEMGPRGETKAAGGARRFRVNSQSLRVPTFEKEDAMDEGKSSVTSAAAAAAPPPPPPPTNADTFGNDPKGRATFALVSGSTDGAIRAMLKKDFGLGMGKAQRVLSAAKKIHKQLATSSPSPQCVVCYSEDFTCLTSLGCGHLLCPDCWQMHIDNALLSGGSKNMLRIMCPMASECNMRVPFDVIEEYGSERAIALRQRFALRQFVGDQMVLKKCPGVGCESVIERMRRRDADKLRQRSVQHVIAFDGCYCDSNLHFFCFECGNLPHDPVSCAVFDKWNDVVLQQTGIDPRNGLTNQSAVDKLSEAWVTKNTKPCTKCGEGIMKMDGCNHMTCVKCKHQWCWM